MGRRLISTLLVAGGVAVTILACSDSNRESPPTAPQFVPTGSGCDFNALKNAAGSEFPNSIKQAIFDSITKMSSFGGSQSETATNVGFNLMAMTKTFGTGTFADADKFLKIDITCMNLGTVDTASLDFSSANGPLGSTGAFGVRGGLPSGDATPVLSADGLWGAQPPAFNTTNDSWDEITSFTSAFQAPVGKRFLLFGAPTSASGFSSETVVGTVFNWHTLPTSINFIPGVLIGTCVNSTNQLVLQHDSDDLSTQTIEPFAAPTFCPATISEETPETGWTPLAIVRRVARLLSPKPVYATALALKTVVGGSTGSLSPTAGVDPGTLKFTFPYTETSGSPLPTSGLLYKIFPPSPGTIQALVTAQNGTVMKGVPVTLAGVNNNGTFGGLFELVDVNPTTGKGRCVVPQRKTDENGVATFDHLLFVKTGSYRFVASLAAAGGNILAQVTPVTKDNVKPSGLANPCQ